MLKEVLFLVLLVTQILCIVTIGRLRDRIDLLSLGLRATNCRIEMQDTRKPCEDSEAIKVDAEKLLKRSLPSSSEG